MLDCGNCYHVKKCGPYESTIREADECLRFSPRLHCANCVKFRECKELLSPHDIDDFVHESPCEYYSTDEIVEIAETEKQCVCSILEIANVGCPSARGELCRSKSRQKQEGDAGNEIKGIIQEAGW